MRFFHENTHTHKSQSHTELCYQCTCLCFFIDRSSLKEAVSIRLFWSSLALSPTYSLVCGIIISRYICTDLLAAISELNKHYQNDCMLMKQSKYVVPSQNEINIIYVHVTMDCI